MELTHFRCKRCGHQWIPRKERIPKVCPKCKSPYWNRKRLKGEYRCRAWLFVHLSLLEKPASKIAKECGVDKTTIYKWIKRFNLLIS